MPDTLDKSEIPEVTEVDELATFIAKKNKIWLWTAVNHKAQGIIAWVIGDRSAKTFKYLWRLVRCWHSYFYITDSAAVASLRASG